MNYRDAKALQRALDRIVHRENGDGDEEEEDDAPFEPTAEDKKALEAATRPSNAERVIAEYKAEQAAQEAAAAEKQTRSLWHK